MERLKNKKLDIILLIIIILLLLLLFFYQIYSSDSNLKTPSGNVDIFEIECNDVDCTCEEKETEDDDNTTNDNNGDNTSTGDSSSNATDTPAFEEVEGEFTIKDKSITWSSNNKLNIFSNPVYDMAEKIAPESTNIYQFVISNNTNYNINYSLAFLEDNTYGINMKYRLKKNSDYVKGNADEWVEYSDLNLDSISLDANTNDTYYLEWKWFSSDNDTEIGLIEDATYSLSINITAESVS